MSNAHLPTIAVLYGGEMGAALARVLIAKGIRVVTTIAGRSEATAARTRDAGMEILPSIDAIAQTADVVISLVTPASAEETATQVLAALKGQNRRITFIELNSISPQSAIRIADAFQRDGHAFVDGAVNGLAGKLADGATLLLSGEFAKDIAGLFEPEVRVQIVGGNPGDASLMKMLLSGMSKGICALYTEMAVTANTADALPAFNTLLGRIYPGVWQLVERMLPTYSVHAARRLEEMGELESAVRLAGIEPQLSRALRDAHGSFTKADFASNPPVKWDVNAIIDRMNPQAASPVSKPASAGSECSHG